VLTVCRRADLDGFLSHPRRFFETVSPREARNGELNTFKTHVLPRLYSARIPLLTPVTYTTSRVLASYESQERTHGKPTGDNRVKAHFCSLRLFELTAEERWKTTRRLVVSSWAGDRAQPWCESHCESRMVCARPRLPKKHNFLNNKSLTFRNRATAQWCPPVSLGC
jgi:hypothetical protein